MKSTVFGFHAILLVICAFSFSSSIANAFTSWSTLGQADSTSLNLLLRSSVRAAADSIGRKTKLDIERLQKQTARVADSASGALRTSVERLIRESEVELAPSRRDTLRNMVTTMERTLALYMANIRGSMDESTRAFQKEMLILEPRFSNCEDCESYQDVQPLLDEYLAASDSLADILHQSLEDINESIDDSLEVFGDLLEDASSDVIDRQEVENDYAASHSSRFILSASYISNVAYRGRDGGVKQSAFSPQLAYKHRSGLFVAGSAAWLNNSISGWDQRYIGAGYEFELGKYFAGALSYTHFRFSDSSQLERAELTNSIDGELSLLSKSLNASLGLGLAFGTASEFTTEFSLSHEFEVDRFLGRAGISIEPTVTAIVGGQNSSLTQKRLKRAVTKKGKVVAVVQSTTQTKDYFGILDYEFEVPIVFSYENAMFSPTLSYAIPINVLDASDTAPFFYFSFSASYTIR